MKNTIIPSRWTKGRIAQVRRKYGKRPLFLCRKNGCDALAVQIASDEYVVLRGSIVAPVDDAFNAKVNLIQCRRRVAAKFNRIQHGRLKMDYSFSTLASAAQFVRAKHSARATDWMSLELGQ